MITERQPQEVLSFGAHFGKLEMYRVALGEREDLAHRLRLMILDDQVDSVLFRRLQEGFYEAFAQRQGELLEENRAVFGKSSLDELFLKLYGEEKQKELLGQLNGDGDQIVFNIDRPKLRGQHI